MKKMVGITATNCPEMVMVSYWGEREMANTRPWRLGHQLK
jgi:hypothetical protein